MESGAMRKIDRLAWILAFSSAGIAFGADAARFSLCQAVPDDVYVLVAGRHNPKRAFLDQYWGKVFDAFANCGAMEEIWDLCSANVSEGDMKQVEQLADTAKQLISKVRWSELFAQQMVYTGRAGFPIWDSVILTENTADSTAKNFKGLREILVELAKMSGGAVRVEDEEAYGAKVARLVFADAPFAICVARRNEVLAISLGDSLLKDCLAMLAGKSNKSPLVGTSRFKDALRDLPPADDSLMFMDTKRFMGDLKQIFATVRKQVVAQKHDDSAEGGGDQDAKVFGLMNRILNDIAIWDYVAQTSRTEGFRVIEESRVALTADAKSRAAYRVFVPQGKFDDLDRLVPRDATGFSVSEGMQFAALYDYIVGLIKEGVPDGGALLSQWKSWQEAHDLDVRKDVLGLFEGAVISVSMPGAVPGANSWVILAKVRDEKKAANVVQRMVDCVQGLLGEQQQTLMLSDVEVAGHDTFHSVSHPLLMMAQIPPIVWGTADGYLIVGSGSKPIGACLKTLAGKSPGIGGNARFRDEGIMPKGPFVSASFTDTSRTAEELRAALTGMTMAMGMITTFAPVPDDQGGKILKAIPSITGKLVRVADRMNFFKSEACATTFDSKGWRTTAYTNYKDPATLKEPVNDEEEDENGVESKQNRSGEERKAKRRKPKSDDSDSGGDNDGDD